MPKSSEEPCVAVTQLPPFLLDFIRESHAELLKPTEGDSRGLLLCGCVTHKKKVHASSAFCGGNQQESNQFAGDYPMRAVHVYLNSMPGLRGADEATRILVAQTVLLYVCFYKGKAARPKEIEPPDTWFTALAALATTLSVPTEVPTLCKTARDTINKYAKATPHLDPKHVTALFTRLQDQLATVLHVEDEIDKAMGELCGEMDERDGKLRGEMDERDGELRGELDALRARIDERSTSSAPSSPIQMRGGAPRPRRASTSAPGTPERGRLPLARARVETIPGTPRVGKPHEGTPHVGTPHVGTPRVGTRTPAADSSHSATSSSRPALGRLPNGDAGGSRRISARGMADLGDKYAYEEEGATSSAAAPNLDADGVEVVSPPPPPPRATEDLTVDTPPPPHLTEEELCERARAKLRELFAAYLALDEQRRKKRASMYCERVASGREPRKDMVRLIHVITMRHVFQRALAEGGYDEDDAYRTLDTELFDHGFQLEAWDTDQQDYRVYTCTQLADEDNGFTWGVWEFSTDDEIGEEPAFMAKEREGECLVRAGEGIVRAWRGSLSRRSTAEGLACHQRAMALYADELTDDDEPESAPAPPMAAGGLLRLETRADGSTEWAFAF